MTFCKLIQVTAKTKDLFCFLARISVKSELWLTNRRSPFDPFDQSQAAQSHSKPGHDLDIVWVLLAVAGRLVLDTEYSVLIGDNILLLFQLSLALGESHTLVR